MKKTISIIIPAYNSQSTIEKCLLSIIDQKCESVERIIVVNDGSKDNTCVVVDKLREIYPCIELINKTNGGVSSARNRGITVAKSEYIMFVDSDDELQPGSIAAMVAMINDVDLLVGGIELHQDSSVQKITFEGEMNVIEVINHYGMTIPSLLINGPYCKLFNRSIISKNNIRFEEKVSLGEDTLFVFEYLRYCNKIRFINNNVYIYYQLGTDSLMTKFRLDGYDNAEMVYKRLITIAKSVNRGIVPQSLVLVYKRVLMIYLRKMIYNSDKLEKKQLPNTIQRFFEDKYVQKAVSYQKDDGLLQKITNKLIYRKMNGLFTTLLKVHVRIRGV